MRTHMILSTEIGRRTNCSGKLLADDNLPKNSLNPNYLLYRAEDNAAKSIF